MSLPRGDEYVGAMQNPQVAFGDPANLRGDRDLAYCTAAVGKNGLPFPLSGGFTMTFHCFGKGDWAVRCFTSEVRELKERYNAITAFLKGGNKRLFAAAELVEEGILVKGRRFDIIKMEWVNGRQLDAFVGASVQNKDSMHRLSEEILAVGKMLETLNMAHGDLQHGNILVEPTGAIRLVDYDDMYLPSLSHLNFSSGLGHRNYQHPGRSSHDFGPTMDRFSLFSIYVSMLALAEDSTLWSRFKGGDERLLFSQEDYKSPSTSALFGELSSFNCANWINRFAAVCEAPYSAIPNLADFLEGRFPYSRLASKTVRTTPQASGIAAFALYMQNATPTAATRKSQPAAAAPSTAPPVFSWAPASVPAGAGGSTQRVGKGKARVGYVVLAIVGWMTFNHFVHPGYSSQTESAQTESTPDALPSTLPVPSDNSISNQSAVPPPALTVEPSATVSPTSPVVTPTAVPISKPQALQFAIPATGHPLSTGGVLSEPRNLSGTSSPKSTPAKLNVEPSNDSDQSAAARLAAAAAAETSAPSCGRPDQPAHVIAQASPVAHADALGAPQGTSVAVNVQVGATGALTDAVVQTPGISPAITTAALDVARRSTYAPAIRSCAATSGSMTVTVTF